MTVVLDSRPFSTAAKAAIKAAVGAASDVYDYSTVPGSNGRTGTLPTSYVIVAVERRFNPNLRASAQASMTGWRITVRCVSTTVTNVALLLSAVAQGLNEKRLTIDGVATTPIQFESDQTPDYDNGRYSALAVYTFAH